MAPDRVDTGLKTYFGKRIMLTRRQIEEAKERGHQHIHCQVCDYKGWSDDSGECPRANEEWHQQRLEELKREEEGE